jgi:hypothetical protein
VSTYVYGIARADRLDLPDGLEGIGDPPTTVRTLVRDDLAAVVGDAPDQVRPKRRDLLAHQRVLSRAAAGGPVLPMRFGSLSADDDAVLAVLDERAGHWHERLAALEGAAEYNVKAAHDGDAVLRQVLAEEPEIRALSDANRAAGGGSHEDKLRLGELVAQAVRVREERDAPLVRQALEGTAQAVRPGPDSGGWLVNVSFLVRTGDADRFMAAADALARAHPHLELTVNGPLPPYSFVEPDERDGTGSPASGTAGAAAAAV